MKCVSKNYYEEAFVVMVINSWILGGGLGPVSARVRTVGGGESWDRDFDPTPGGNNDTIGGILSNRDIGSQAIVGQDYVQLDALVDFAVRFTDILTM